MRKNATSFLHYSQVSFFEVPLVITILILLDGLMGNSDWRPPLNSFK
jgi:hypothetical protein